MNVVIIVECKMSQINEDIMILIFLSRVSGLDKALLLTE